MAEENRPPLFRSNDLLNFSRIATLVAVIGGGMLKDFLGSVRFKILLAVVLVMLGFITASVYRGGAAPMLSHALGFITVPVQRISANISYSVSEFFQKYTNSAALYEQNRYLQEELTAAWRKLADYERIKHENDQFREIMRVMESRQDLSVKTASVIARDPVSHFYSFSIDKGSLDDIRYLDPVMSADGLVGYVSEVGLTYAKVRTILDVNINIGAYEGRTQDISLYNSATRDIGVVSGTIDLADEGLCQMQYLPRDSAIKEGDIILTSGGGLFPKDILVGTVERVEHGTNTVAIIRPVADISGVKNVFVITEFEGQGME